MMTNYYYKKGKNYEKINKIKGCNKQPLNFLSLIYILIIYINYIYYFSKPNFADKINKKRAIN